MNLERDEANGLESKNPYETETDQRKDTNALGDYSVYVLFCAIIMFSLWVVLK